MKTPIPHQFFIYASQFTQKSMIEKIVHYSYELFKCPDPNWGRLGAKKHYTLDGRIHNSVFIAQPWLIDMLYDVICLENYGAREITLPEALHLIALYNTYNNKAQGIQISQTNVLLYVYGFLGEQILYQKIGGFAEEFAREKYIIDVISKKNHPDNKFKIDIENEIIEEIGFTSNEYSCLMLLLSVYFSFFSPSAKKTNIKIDFTNSVLSYVNFTKIMDRYAVTIKEIRNSKLNRQIFYSKPLIKIEDEYIASNPLLMLRSFVNGNYWLMRNRYKNKQKNSTLFINEFGIYFEMYVEEILGNCIEISKYKKIPKVNNEKRADWHLSLCGFDILVEQKSGLSLLGIKQNQPDIELLKNHILKDWKEAVLQLESTQKAFNLQKPIKIILVYEEYYQSECLDELFKLDATLTTDKKYWLITIREFEMLLMTYKENPELFKKIVLEKDAAEIKESKDGRGLIFFLENNGITQNKYLQEFGVLKEFEIIENIIISEMLPEKSTSRRINEEL